LAQRDSLKVLLLWFWSYCCTFFRDLLDWLLFYLLIDLLGDRFYLSFLRRTWDLGRAQKFRLHPVDLAVLPRSQAGLQLVCVVNVEGVVVLIVCFAVATLCVFLFDARLCLHTLILVEDGLAHAAAASFVSSARSTPIKLI